MKTQTYFRTPKTASQAAFIARIVARAEMLFTESGYRYKRMARTPWFACFRPDNTDTRASRRDYLVDVSSHTCDCEAFEKAGDCKHRIAVALMLDAEAELCERYEEESQPWRELGFESRPLFV